MHDHRRRADNPDKSSNHRAMSETEMSNEAINETVRSGDSVQTANEEEGVNCHSDTITGMDTSGSAESADTNNTGKPNLPKAKRAKTDKTNHAKPKKVDDPNRSQKTTQNPGQSTQSTQSIQPKPKRGPARPHRRLAADVIETRITKLQKRLDRARSQIEDAARHVEGYLRERDFRAKEEKQHCPEIQVSA
jgi:hypothetical protein